MTNLVIKHDKQAVTTSLQVAETFGKEHSKVIRSIEGIAKSGDTPQMFAKDTYINPQNNQKYPMYYMNRDGFTLLAMGFTGKKALDFKLQYIDAFNSMEATIKRVPEKKLDPIQQAELNDTRAKTAKANALYRIATKTSSKSAEQNLLAEAAALLLGHKVIPTMEHEEFSAGEAGKQLGISGNKVGRIAKQIGLKAEQPGQNEYGRWANSKSQHSDKEVAQWLYTEAGVKAIGKTLNQEE